MDTTTSDDDLLTTEQVAAKLQLHIVTIRRYIREKKLRAVRFNARNVRIRRSELERFVHELETDKDID